MLLVMNAHSEVVASSLPECADGRGWDLLVDTKSPMRMAAAFRSATSTA
jgi:hypothetical protein